MGKLISEKMGLITINYENFLVTNVTEATTVEDDFEEVFETDKIGKIPGRPSASEHPSKQHSYNSTSTSRAHIHQGKGEEKNWHELEMKEVITRVDEPTDWVNQMAVQVKKSGDVTFVHRSETTKCGTKKRTIPAPHARRCTTGALKIQSIHKT